MSPFFRLLLGHLVGDFVLQTIDLVRYKADSWKGLLLHSGIVLGSMALFLWGGLPRWWVWLALLFFLHILTDWGKVVLSRRFAGWGLGLFFLDQALHVAAILGVIWLVSGNWPLSSLSETVGGTTMQANRNLLFLLAFLVAFFIVPVLEVQVSMGVTRREADCTFGDNCPPASLWDRLFGGAERVVVLGLLYLGGGLVWLAPLAFVPRLVSCWRQQSSSCASQVCWTKFSTSVLSMLLLGVMLWLLVPAFR